MDTAKLQQVVETTWHEQILPALEEYIRIPNRSPAFDPDWAANGHMDRAFDLAEAWCRRQSIPGLVVERVQLEGRTPLLHIPCATKLTCCVAQVVADHSRRN